MVKLSDRLKKIKRHIIITCDIMQKRKIGVKIDFGRESIDIKMGKTVQKKSNIKKLAQIINQQNIQKKKKKKTV